MSCCVSQLCEFVFWVRNITGKFVQHPHCIALLAGDTQQVRNLGPIQLVRDIVFGLRD